MLKFVPNYWSNLLEIRKIDDEVAKGLTSELSLVATFLKYSKDIDRLKKAIEGDERFRQVDHETAVLLSEMTSSADKLLKDVEDKKEEKVDMCKALADLEARSIARGRDEGINIGEARGISIGESRGINIGESKGRAESLWNLMKIGQMPIEEEMRLLGIPAADRAKYEKLMEGMK